MRLLSDILWRTGRAIRKRLSLIVSREPPSIHTAYFVGRRTTRGAERSRLLVASLLTSSEPLHPSNAKQDSPTAEISSGIFFQHSTVREWTAFPGQRRRPCQPARCWRRGLPFSSSLQRLRSPLILTYLQWFLQKNDSQNHEGPAVRVWSDIFHDAEPTFNRGGLSTSSSQEILSRYGRVRTVRWD